MPYKRETLAFALYAIELATVPLTRIDEPPSRSRVAGKRIYCYATVNIQSAVDLFNLTKKKGAWPNGYEPEIRDLREGHVVCFKSQTGTWVKPHPLDDLTGSWL